MKLNIQGSDYNVEILKMEGAYAQVKVNGQVFEVKIDGNFTSQVAQPQAASVAAPQAPAAPVAPAVEDKPQYIDNSTALEGNYKFTSPLPGIILSIDVNVGDKVTSGQKLLMLEAMKMENNITSDVDGVVTAIKVSKGDAVMEGDILIELAK